MTDASSRDRLDPDGPEPIERVDGGGDRPDDDGAAPEILLFSDGACSGNPGPGGWGVILRHVASGKEKKLSGGEPETTNNRMELTAVIEGLKAIQPTRRWRIRVVTDSEYVVKGMTEWMEGWIANDWRRGGKGKGSKIKNAELWRELLEWRRRFDVSFEHVRGHAGHPENEECDRMAVEAGRRFA